jgi:hypothetical protein
MSASAPRHLHRPPPATLGPADKAMPVARWSMPTVTSPVAP